MKAEELKRVIRAAACFAAAMKRIGHSNRGRGDESVCHACACNNDEILGHSQVHDSNATTNRSVLFTFPTFPILLMVCIKEPFIFRDRQTLKSAAQSGLVTYERIACNILSFGHHIHSCCQANVI